MKTPKIQDHQLLLVGLLCLVLGGYTHYTYSPVASFFFLVAGFSLVTIHVALKYIEKRLKEVDRTSRLKGNIVFLGRSPSGRAFGTRCLARTSLNELKQSLNH